MSAIDDFLAMLAAERGAAQNTIIAYGRDLAQAEEIVRTGGQWLDVRLPSEFENQHLDVAINIPLYFIRLKISTLDKSKKYVVCCDTGRRSSAGAYILNERGFQAYVLQGGINAETA